MTKSEGPVAALARRIIQAQGPISIAALMRLANTAMPDSYYQAQQPFGAAGDFVTAPEISQMFGEMLALALADQWQRMGCPPAVDLVELGPGRGVLMADILRTWRQAAPALLVGASITLIETSERLKAQQAEALSAHADNLSWSTALPDGDRPMLLVANEFFDALPIQQFVRFEDGWRERMVHWDEARGFHDAMGPLVTAITPPQGDVWEFSAEAAEWAAAIAKRLQQQGGLALIVDYASLPGQSSLRGVAQHRRASPLEGLGAVDLSAGVDFAALANEASMAGAAAIGTITQGHYLSALGIHARHAQLAANASPSKKRELDAGLQRLIAPDGMGACFHVMAMIGPQDPPPAAFETSA